MANATRNQKRVNNGQGATTEAPAPAPKKNARKKGAEEQPQAPGSEPSTETQPQAPEQLAPASIIPDDIKVPIEKVKVHTEKVKAVDADQLATNKQIRDIEGITRKDDSLVIPFESIIVRKDWNLRKDFGNIEELAMSILNHGLERKLTVEVLTDGKVYLVDGERRYRAIAWLRANGLDKIEGKDEAKFDRIECFLKNGEKMTEEQRLVSMMTSNTGKEFTPMEEAEGFRRLRDEYGYTQLKQIAEQVGRSVPYVEQRLILADATPEERQHIEAGIITETAFVLLSRVTDNAAERLGIMDDAKKKGTKVKVKDVKARSNGKNSGGESMEDEEESGEARVTRSGLKADDRDAAYEIVKEAQASQKSIKDLKMNNDVAEAYAATNKLLAKLAKMLKQ